MEKPQLRTAVTSSQAPSPAPFLSQAIISGDHVFCSGQVGVDPATGSLVEGTVKTRTERIIKNLAAVLEKAGSSLDLVVKANIYLVEPSDFAAMNEVYSSLFADPKPARTCVFVKALPLGTDVEIECTARLARPGKARL